MSKTTRLAARSVWSCAIALTLSLSLSGAAIADPADDPTAPYAQDYPAMNAPNGAYFHGFAVDSLEGVESGWGIYNGDTVEADCWVWSDPVGPFDNHIWVLAANLTRPTTPSGRANSGFINTHYVNDGQVADHDDPNLPHCGQI